MSQRARVVALLRSEAFDVHEAADGRVALDLCRIVQPDLLILDLALPRLQGWDVLARVRRDRKLATMPVLVLTADEREATVAAVLDAGATDFICKPARSAELLARVRRALREKSSVDQLVAHNQALSDAADTDALTGLPNRRASAEALAVAASRARELGRPLTVALVDIDHFKVVNDTYGHTAGDEVLRTIATRLSDGIRPIGVVGRWGGEEFLAVLPDAGSRAAGQACETLRVAASAAPVTVDEHAVHITVSIGWACDVDSPPDELVDLADKALYEAKAGGRNCVRAAAGRRPESA